MRVAVLTLTRDRLDYTKHCFDKLLRFSGCGYDHYVLDQGSRDGTYEWLQRESDVKWIVRSYNNVGINRGMNVLLEATWGNDYDVIVKVDNDCELTQPNTLRDICELVHEHKVLLSPRILGLNNPPAAWGEYELDGETIIDIPQIGGIFIAAPADIYQTFRYDESRLLDDDVELCWWYRGQGGRCGYVKRLKANHYETTSGQHARYPDYFQRTLAEGKPSL